MAILLDQRPVISEGDVDLVAIDYTRYLDADELLDGTPTVTSLGAVASYETNGRPVYETNTDLIFDNEAVSAEELEILDKRVIAGKAVQFQVSGQQADVTYGVQIEVDTDSTPPRTKVVDVLLTTAE